MMMQKLVVFVSLFALTQAVNWSRGAQNNNSATPFTAACISGNFRPSNDDFMPQTSPSPFQLTIETVKRDGKYYPGEPVTILIESINRNLDMFESYHLRGDCSKPVFNGTLTCVGGVKSNLCNIPKNKNTEVDAVTNTNNKMKNVVRCQWVPPTHSIGSVQFSATIVQTYDKFWTGVLSEVIKPSFGMTSYEAHQESVVAQKMNDFRQMQAQAMQKFNTMMGNARNQMGQMGQMGQKASNNPFASMFAAAASKNNQQNSNPMQQMQQMQQLMGGFGAAAQSQNSGMGGFGAAAQAQNVGFMGQAGKWGGQGGFNFGGENSGGEASENNFGGW